MPDIDAALRMIDAFVALGATNFDLSVVEHVVQEDGGSLDARVPGRQLTRASVRELRSKLPQALAVADVNHHSVILRPRPVDGLLWVQLDDLDAQKVVRVHPYSFLVIETSRGKFQAWIALTDAPRDKQAARDFVLRLRRGVGADFQATGAARLAGSRNFKSKYAAKGFPVVEVVHVELVFVSCSQLDGAGLVAPAVQRPPLRLRPVRSSVNRKWARMEDVLRTAPIREDTAVRLKVEQNQLVRVFA
jgi:hypothetical protein